MGWWALVCPILIMAQIHYKIARDEGKPKYARNGYFFIILVYAILLVLITLCLSLGRFKVFGSGAEGYGVFDLIYVASFVLLLGLYKRARSLYSIKGNFCAGCCGTNCCPDACSDCCDVLFCYPCAVARLGHHVFNYDHKTSTDGAITYEPLATDFDPCGDMA